ncbi:MAG: ATP-binding protein [Bacillota bacterium]
MRKTSLRFKLSMAFMLVALVLFVLVSLFANLILERQFKAYTVSKLEKTIEDTVKQIASRFENAQSWNASAIEDIGVNALSEGFMLRVTGVDGAVIWDAWRHNNGFCTDMLEHMAMNMQSYDSGFQGGYREEAYPIKINGQAVGSVDVGYYGPYFYSDADIRFLKGLNEFLLIAGGISLLACLLLGAFMAKRLTEPIAGVIETAGRIAKGDLGSRIAEKSSTREIAELTDSINSMAQELSGQELLRKQLTTDVAHELRTPLATLQSHMEAMIDGVWEPEQKRLVSCHEEILRLSKLVGELETLSRYDSESLELNKERFEISELIQRILLNFESGFQSKGVALEFSGGEAFVVADRDKISQVLFNLISNALKYTPEGGKVRIEAKETPNEVSVCVSDTGIGIPESDLPYIFERFYRTDKSRSRATGGTGIGLTIAKSIIEAHGGTIAVESKTNRGSTFTVSLPK